LLSLGENFQEYSFDSVVHFAGLKVVAESQMDPLKYYDHDISGSASLFKAMLNTNLHQLVFSSTATVYGAPEIPIYTGDLPKNSINVYGQTELMIRKSFVTYPSPTLNLGQLFCITFIP
jgi:UDP-glucose 4-epimerase